MKNLIGVLCLIFSTNAFAVFHCVVDVKRVLIYSTGIINVLHTGHDSYTNICNLKSTWKEVDQITCAMWTGLLQNSQVNNQKVIFYYSGEGSCAALPTYGATPAPVYIGTVKP